MTFYVFLRGCTRFIDHWSRLIPSVPLDISDCFRYKNA